MVIVTVVSSCVIMGAILGFGGWFVNGVRRSLEKMNDTCVCNSFQ